MKIASIQLNIIWENKKENLKKSDYFIDKAVQDKCDLIIFPEMFTTGFSMNGNLTSENKGGLTHQYLVNKAKQNNIDIIAGYVEKNNQQLENIAVAIDCNGLLKSRYVKNYPYTPSGETKVYRKGYSTVTFDLYGVKASVFICYDLRFPELFRKIANEVSIVFVIASWPNMRQKHWEVLLRARAIENQLFIVGVNRTGDDGNNLKYEGGSRVYDPLGNLVTSGEATQEYILSEIDLSLVEKIRNELPFLLDMKSL